MKPKPTASPPHRWLCVTLDTGTVVKAFCRVQHGAPLPSGKPRSMGVWFPPGGKRVVDDDPATSTPTPHELASRALLAERVGCSPDRLAIVVDLPPGGACDYADASDGIEPHLAFGQAIRRQDGTWAQEPRGKRPVLLAWMGEVG